MKKYSTGDINEVCGLDYDLDAIFAKASKTDAERAKGGQNGRPMSKVQSRAQVERAVNIDIDELFLRASAGGFAGTTSSGNIACSSRSEHDYLSYIKDRVGEFIGHSIMVKDYFVVWYPAGVDKKGETIFKPARMRRAAGAWIWDGGRWTFAQASKKGGTGPGWQYKGDDGYRPPTQDEKERWFKQHAENRLSEAALIRASRRTVNE